MGGFQPTIYAYASAWAIFAASVKSLAPRTRRLYEFTVLHVKLFLFSVVSWWFLGTYRAKKC
jgi:hypothetical protein